MVDITDDTYENNDDKEYAFCVRTLFTGNPWFLFVQPFAGYYTIKRRKTKLLKSVVIYVNLFLLHL